MKKLSITFGTILLVLGCFALSPTVKADDGHGIVGLWNVHYFVGTTEIFQTYDQWHSDGQEFEAADLAPGVMCQGTWKNWPHGSVKLFHVGFTFGGGCPGGTDVRFEETQINTVSHDRNSYDGMYDDTYYDANGNVACQLSGTLHATRLSVH